MLLELEHLSVSYAGVPALHDVCLGVERGACVGIAGASGSGKSTLARAIAGLLGEGGVIDEGAVRFDGHDLTRAAASTMRELRGEHIGFVFQDPQSSFSPIRRLSVQYHEAMAEHGHVDQDANDRLLLAMFERLGLPGGRRVLRSYPFELSGGMAQRVAIALACAMRPQLLVADEPTSALDVTFQAQVVGELLELHEEYGTSLLLVSHNLAMLGYACDTICVMCDGHIVESGTPEQVLCSPQDTYTRQLVAAAPSLEKAGA